MAIKRFKDMINEDLTGRDQELSLSVAREIVDRNMHEIFREFQDANGVDRGDISPEDSFELDKIKDELSNLLVKVTEKNL